MTKRDIVVAISDKYKNIKQIDVGKIVQDTLDILAEQISSGENIELRKFGSFKVIRRKSRIGRNPNNPQQTYKIPERLSITFKASKKLEERLRNNHK